MSRRKERTVDCQVKSPPALLSHRQWLISDILRKLQGLDQEEFASVFALIQKLHRKE